MGVTSGCGVSVVCVCGKGGHGVGVVSGFEMGVKCVWDKWERGMGVSGCSGCGEWEGRKGGDVNRMKKWKVDSRGHGKVWE